ncbi:hypothetical protein V1508DRAFT_82439 [Lipomyces doorenjongii]|uniref:uncharacterized protein n=1 Tax=Lipomyces doorenjongii TaxID=383834 RepID=UPI0034CE07D8
MDLFSAMSARKIKAASPPVGAQTSVKKQRTLASFFGGSTGTRPKQRPLVTSRLDSDPALEPENESRSGQKNNFAQQALPSPTTPNTNPDVREESSSQASRSSTPTRRAKSQVRYKEDSDDAEEEEFVPSRRQSRQRTKAMVADGSDDEFIPVSKDDSFERNLKSDLSQLCLF